MGVSKTLGRFQTRNLMIHIKELEKQEQIQHNVSRKKEATKIRAKIKQRLRKNTKDPENKISVFFRRF